MIEAYSNLFQTIRTVISKITLCNTKTVKASTQKLFDEKVIKNINVETNFLKDLRKLDFILLKSDTKKQNNNRIIRINRINGIIIELIIAQK